MSIIAPLTNMITTACNAIANIADVATPTAIGIAIALYVITEVCSE